MTKATFFVGQLLRDFSVRDILSYKYLMKLKKTTYFTFGYLSFKIEVQ